MNDDKDVPEVPKIDPDCTGEQGKRLERRIDYPRRTLSREEYAAEFDAIRERKLQISRPGRVKTRADTEDSSGTIAGIAGVVLGILALFMWTIVLGPLAAVLGYYAYSQEKTTTGSWGLALGIIATLSYFILMPFVR